MKKKTKLEPLFIKKVYIISNKKGDACYMTSGGFKTPTEAMEWANDKGLIVTREK